MWRRGARRGSRQGVACGGEGLARLGAEIGGERLALRVEARGSEGWLV